MHSAPDHNLDAGRVVNGVVVSVILIYATSMEQLTPSLHEQLCVSFLRSIVGSERHNSAPSSGKARVNGSMNASKTPSSSAAEA